MHIRPIYWILLVVCCLSTFCFALFWQEHVPAHLLVRVEQQERAEEVAVVVHLNDSQGLPLEGAHVTAHATMPTMTMPDTLLRPVQQVEPGCYRVYLTFSMSGQWLLTLSAELPNFLVSPQKVMLSVPSTSSAPVPIASVHPLPQVRC